MTNEVTLRPAGEADVEALVALDRASFGVNAWPADAFAQALASSNADVVCLEAEGEVRGCCAMTIIPPEAEVGSLAIAADWRGRGWGGRLLDCALARATARGVREVFLEVRASNEAALALYRSRGFAVIDRRRRYYRHPLEDAVVMRARLTRAVASAPGAADDVRHTI